MGEFERRATFGLYRLEASSCDDISQRLSVHDHEWDGHSSFGDLHGGGEDSLVTAFGKHYPPLQGHRALADSLNEASPAFAVCRGVTQLAAATFNFELA
jgi:hypothetical protein